MSLTASVDPKEVTACPALLAPEAKKAAMLSVVPLKFMK
jgi:hypothetical protein